MHIHVRSATLLVVALVSWMLGGCGGGGGGGGPAGGGGDGTIYYSNVDGQIWQLTLGDGQIKKLIVGNQPDRTPQGTFIYTSPVDLVESSDGVMVRTIVKSVNSPPGYNNSFSMPRLSPDGTLVAYESLGNRSYVVKRDSGQLVSSWADPGNSTYGYERPSWTQDGRVVVAGDFSNPGLYISDAAFTTLTRFDPMLSAPSQPSVSPDGKRVAFIVNQHVAVMNLDGSGLQTITTGNGTETFPAWSPDGSKLAAWNQYTLITFNADGTGTLYDVVAAHPEIFYNFLSDIPFCWR